MSASHEKRSAFRVHVLQDPDAFFVEFILDDEPYHLLIHDISMGGCSLKVEAAQAQLISAQHIIPDAKFHLSEGITFTCTLSLISVTALNEKNSLLHARFSHFPANKSSLLQKAIYSLEIHHTVHIKDINNEYVFILRK